MITIEDLIRKEGREPGGLAPKGKWYKLTSWFYVPKGSSAFPVFKLSGSSGSIVYADGLSITDRAPKWAGSKVK